jgi:chromate transporter
VAGPESNRADPADASAPGGSVVEVFVAALRLGLTSFGGPVAHIGYFQDEYVKRRRWVDEETFADLVALSQSLPGAASSKLGMSIGMIRAGLPGGIAAWLGFTLPSALVMILFAIGAGSLGTRAEGWLHGLQVVAVAVVALAVWTMAGKLAPDLPRGAIAIGAAVVALVLPSRVTIVAIILVAAAIGLLFLWVEGVPRPTGRLVTFGRGPAIAAAVLFVVLLVGLPVASQVSGSHAVALVDSTYRAGALVFGGGQVVLPLLQPDVVGPGWLTQEQALAGFGAAQAMPGPLFTYGAYVGAAAASEPNGFLGGVIGLLGIFAPSFLIVVATMPSFGAIRSNAHVQAMLRGVNAAVVGILLAALYDPLWTSSISSPIDCSLLLVSFGLLVLAKLPPWLVVVATAAGGALIGVLS